MTRVLFVCLGNICRSPAAEGIFIEVAKKAKIPVHVDSAGTGSWHVGDPPDGRMIHHAKTRGYDLSALEARQFDASTDFEGFDMILTMDDSNYRNVTALDPKGKYRDKVFKMTSFCRVHTVTQVPDPYERDADGFELVLDILEDACDGLLKKSAQEAANDKSSADLFGKRRRAVARRFHG